MKELYKAAGKGANKTKYFLSACRLLGVVSGTRRTAGTNADTSPPHGTYSPQTEGIKQIIKFVNN